MPQTPMTFPSRSSSRPSSLRQSISIESDLSRTPPSSTETKPSSTEIKLLLWNTWLLPSIVTDHSTGQRASQISPLLNSYPLVILNEAFTHSTALLAECTHPYTYRPPHPRNKIFGSGLLFLSRWEIVDTAWERFEKTAGIDWWACKGVAAVKVRIEGENEGEIWVVGTHMQAAASRGAQGARKGQAEQVVRFVDALLRRKGIGEGGRRVLFAGDLNMGPPVDGGGWSVHYVDESDARAREGAYGCLVDGAGLEEVEVEEEYREEYGGDVCRVLTRGLNGRVRYESLSGPGGTRLSDTKPICFRGCLDAHAGTEIG